MENTDTTPAGVMDMAREVVDQARKEYAAEERPGAGYEPTLIRHIAAALEVVEGDVDEARGRGDALNRRLLSVRAELDALRVVHGRAERMSRPLEDVPDEEQGDAEDTITVAKDTRRIVLEIQDEARRRAGHGCPPEQVKVDEALYRPTRPPEIPRTERILAGLPPEPPTIEPAKATAEALEEARLPYERPRVVLWEVRFAELVDERVRLSERVDELLAANSLEVQKRRAAEVRARGLEAHQEDDAEDRDELQARVRDLSAALRRCRDHSAEVDLIVDGVLA